MLRVLINNYLLNGYVAVGPQCGLLPPFPTLIIIGLICGQLESWLWSSIVTMLKCESPFSDYNGYVNELIQVFPCLIVACLSNHEYLVFCITGEH